MLNTFASSWAGMPSVMHTTNPMPAPAGLEDRGRRGLRRHGDERRRGACRGHRLGDRVEDRDAVDVLATLAGRHSADDLGAVVAVAQAVVPALPTGETLHDDLGVGVDEDRHPQSALPALAIATAARAASSIVGSDRQLLGRDARRWRGSRGPPRRWCRRGGSRSAPAARPGPSPRRSPWRPPRRG